MTVFPDDICYKYKKTRKKHSHWSAKVRQLAKIEVFWCDTAPKMLAPNLSLQKTAEFT